MPRSESGTGLLPTRSRVIVIGGGAAGQRGSQPTDSLGRTRWSTSAFPASGPRRAPFRALLEQVRRRPSSTSGVGLHQRAPRGHTEGFACDEITHQRVQWSTGSAQARPTPSSGHRSGAPTPAGCPTPLLDEHGFVNVGPTLQTPVRPEVSAIGDVAAYRSRLRSSACTALMPAGQEHSRLHGGRTAHEYRALASGGGSVLGV